jgi:hypothetical protein
MGLLDDAIREHLELKRVRGADPTEVIRQEREALGASDRPEMLAPEVEAGDETQPDHGSSGSASADHAEPRSTDPTPDEDGEHTPAPTEPATSDFAVDDAGDAQPRHEQARMALDQETAEVDMETMLGLEQGGPTAAAAERANAGGAAVDRNEAWSDDAWAPELQGSDAAEHTRTGEDPGEPLEPA